MHNSMRGITWRLRAYDFFQSHVIEPLVLPRFFSAARVRSAQEDAIQLKQFAPEKPGGQRAWFHAASFGELESIWSVVESWSQPLAQNKSISREVIFSVFSESVRNHLERISSVLKANGHRLAYVGYAPWEGAWMEALARVRPAYFVTAKYEAWPELWIALSRLNIPLIIVGARARRSLCVAKQLCLAMGYPLPEMILLAADNDDVPPLRKLFGNAEIHLVGDPRWDRVAQRSKTGNERAQNLVSKLSRLPRPWGVIGSAWKEDLEKWDLALAEFRGTLWVVPHRTDPDHVGPIRALLEQRGFEVLQTSHTQKGTGAGEDRQAVLVDEMGFLSELYASADWAFVGGGFGAGVHSTIEPAIHGISIGTGPKNAEKFPEIAQLTKLGQLTVVRESDEVLEWYRARCHESLETKKNRLPQVQSLLGATQRVLSCFPGSC